MKLKELTDRLAASIVSKNYKSYVMANHALSLYMIKEYGDLPEFNDEYINDFLLEAFKKAVEIDRTCIDFAINTLIAKNQELAYLFSYNMKILDYVENVDMYCVIFDAKLFKKIANEYLELTGELFGLKNSHMVDLGKLYGDTTSVGAKMVSLLDIAIASNEEEIMSYYDPYPEVLRSALAKAIKHSHVEKKLLKMDIAKSKKSKTIKV